MARETNRRGALAVGLGLIAVAAGWQVWIGRERAFVFEDLPGLPGWRRLDGGAVSAGVSGAVFAGLEGGRAVEPLEAERLCEVLFEKAGPGVPVAVFTDLNCPYCREMMPRLATREADGAVTVNWLEWPLFGDGSETAARMLLAAERQGRSDALRKVLYTRGGGAPSRLAAEAGLSVERLRADMESAAVTDRLAEVARAAERLALPGTPGLMVGRTLVVGAMSRERLDRLIEIERAEWAWPCR